MIKKLFLIYIIKFHNSLYECLNGKNPSDLNNKNYLKEFSKGPCSPFIVIPCWTGSKLVVTINCPILKKHNKKIFSTCGWTHCKKKFWEFWKRVPQKEYILYYPKLTSDVNIYSAFKEPGNCFESFMKLNVDFKKPLKDSIKKTIGYEIKVFGDTPSTAKKAGCGDKVITDMFPFIIKPNITKFWKKFFNKAKNMGFRTGITYQSLPFDWRKSYANNKLSQIFLPNIKRLFSLTKKKVIIVGHSYGVKNIYYQLLQIEQGIKDKMIKSWAGVGGNFLGSWFSNLGLIAGSDMYSIFNFFGLSVNNIIKFLDNSLSVYEIRIHDPFVLFEGEKWFEKIKMRIDYEKGVFNDFSKSGFDFLPKKDDICSSENNKFDPFCIMGFFNSTKHYYISINNKEYFEKDLDDLIKEIKIVKDAENYINITSEADLSKLENPGVSYIGFVLRTMPTPAVLIWNEDIKQYLNKGEYYPPNKILNSYGDETVSTTSLLLAPLKWAHEFDEKKPNAKPIKIIDVCSIYNQRNTVYDENDFDKEFKINKNEFIGMNCEDFDKEIPRSAVHARLISDKYWIDFFSNILKPNEITYSKEYDKFIDDLDDFYLDSMGKEDCPQIRFKY